ncbi:MAG: hypothetical protein K2I70_02775, partial [Bacilli bacterium]|nr:hypothetical protein [Bacilli bacterium]
EKIRPVLTLLFSQDATSRYVSETFEISVNQAKELEEDNNTEELSKSKKQKKRANVVPAYSIDPDTLDRLLNTKKTTSQIDQYLIENQQPLLKLYKEYLDAEIFYPDFFTIDSTGNFEISSKHENYIAVGNNDSIIIPEKFGNINIYYGSGMITGYNRTYNPKTEDIRNSSDEICNDDLPERVFIHKALLPTNYRKPQK